MIDGKVHWFGVPGLANGLAVMRDEETESLWDHITGECFDGPLEGHKLDFWHVSLTNVLAERTNYPHTILLKSGYRSVKSSFMRGVIGNRMSYSNEGTILGPHFRNTMSKEVDPRLPEGEQGLGLMEDLEHGKFYPVRMIPEGAPLKMNGWGEWCGLSAMPWMGCLSRLG